MHLPELSRALIHLSMLLAEARRSKEALAAHEEAFVNISFRLPVIDLNEGRDPLEPRRLFWEASVLRTLALRRAAVGRYDDAAIEARDAVKLLRNAALALKSSGDDDVAVEIARALANRPRLLLADEPTGELDRATGEQIAALLDRVQADGTAIVVVTHDVAIAERAARTLLMRDGRIENDSESR